MGTSGEFLIVCYDEDSKAPVNDWLEYFDHHTIGQEDAIKQQLFSSVNEKAAILKNLPKINGPFILINPLFHRYQYANNPFYDLTRSKANLHHNRYYYGEYIKGVHEECHKINAQ